jgi:hypothetical protein
MAHRYDNARGMGDRDLVEDLPDIARDVGVRAQEDAQHVPRAQDADQLAVRAGNRQHPDVVRVHHPHRGRNGRVRVDSDSWRGHQFTGRQARVRRCLMLRCLILGRQQIGFGDHADHLPAVHEHGQAADLVLGQQTSDFLVRGEPVGGHDRCRHHVFDRAMGEYHLLTASLVRRNSPLADAVIRVGRRTPVLLCVCCCAWL